LLSTKQNLDFCFRYVIGLGKSKISETFGEEGFVKDRLTEDRKAIEGVLPGESATARAAHQSLKGERRGLRGLLPFLGPAFVAAVAYVDPGNFATNISAGAQFGYLLLWVVLASNLMAMLVQSMSAKLGIATGKNLPEVCRERFPRPVSLLLWVQAEVIAMATDLAEFIGAALALNLLFGIPLFPAGLVTAVGAFAILELQRRGFRPLEAVISGMVGVIVLAFAFQMFYAEPEGERILAGLFMPGFMGTESVLISAGILGATVMPHVIYLHSALTQYRVMGKTDQEKKRIFRFELVDVVIAMAIAGAINASMLITAAALFNANGLTDVGDIDLAFDRLGALVNGNVAIIFGVALLASGLSSSSVGTMAGQVVMQGFVNRQIPLFLRRLITMSPALIILAIGVNPSRSLVISQVVLSFGIPFALIPLLVFCRNRNVMGVLTNRRPTTMVATVVVALIVSLNVFLLYQTFFG
jgi:manganese transport protein